MVCWGKLLILFILLPVLAWAQETARIDIGLFSQGNTSGWKVREIVGTTDYSLTSVDGKQVLAADSQQTASAYYKKIKVDLNKTPILNWSWRKQQSIDPGNELDKKGDDFAARIFVVKSGGLFLWKTRTVYYVWSFQNKKNTTWNNPFVGNKSKMMALRDGSDPEKIWFSERRNVAKDFIQLHGIEAQKIDGVAIMTDSDSSRLSASALYGDIYFSAE